MATQIDLGAVVPIGKGDWDVGTTYERANIVRHNSVAWICKVDSSTGVEPTEDSSDWYLLVKDTSSVTSVNGQRGDVNLDIISPNDIMVGASDEISGKSGLVPKPEAGDNINKFLKADGTWKKIDLEKYLPLTGGNLTNPISFNSISAIGHYVNTKEVGMLLQSQLGNKGSYFWMYDETSNENPGGFFLASRNGSNISGLEGFPLSGAITWNGKNIVRSVNGINADINGNVNAPYLPLTGGTMTGPLTIVDWMIRKYDASGQTGLQFFNPTDSSAYFWLNNTKHASNPGGFMLAASNGSTTKRLQGEITGKLLWDSKNIVRSVNGINADENGNVNISNTLTKAATTASGKHTSDTNFFIQAVSPNYGTKWLIAEGTVSGQVNVGGSYKPTISATLTAPRIVGPNTVVVSATESLGHTSGSVTITSNTIYAYRLE